MTKRAYQSFAKQGRDGGTVVVSEEDYYPDDHPYVKAWPDMFGDLEDTITVQPLPARVAKTTNPAEPVEQATAEPGEVRRGPGRPRKS